MKIITVLVVSLITLFSLTACVSDSATSQDSGYTQVNTGASAPTTTTENTNIPTVSPSVSTPNNTEQASPNYSTPSEPTAPSISTPTEPLPNYTPTSSASWYRVQMHYGLLQGQSHEWRETGGYLLLKVQENTYAGAYSLKLASTVSLIPKQLITYRGSDEQYYSTTIKSISGNTIQLTTPLLKNVWYGENAWNFYNDPSHPNYRGYLAIADFSLRSIGRGNLNYGKHVLLGDSWFSAGVIRDRFKESLSNARFTNLGIGGNTSNDLLSRFDSVVPAQRPDFVWILTGTNDYWGNISASSYKQNIQTLISKIEAIGAKAIIIDPSVAPLNYGSRSLTRLSHAYTDAIAQLHGD